MIPPVVASDRGRAQTVCVAMHMRGCRTTPWHTESEKNVLESSTIAGESPLIEA